MSELNTIVDAVYDQLDDYSSLSYVKSLTKYQDEDYLEDQGLFPYINIDIYDYRVVNADNMEKFHMERRVYPIVITMGNRHKIKTEIKEGSGNFKGLFEIYDDIKAAIFSDLTFGGAVNEFPWRPDYSTVCYKHPNGEFWIGNAILIFELYKDVLLV